MGNYERLYEAASLVGAKPGDSLERLVELLGAAGVDLEQPGNLATRDYP
jgi:hypothetical protein